MLLDQWIKCIVSCELQILNFNLSMSFDAVATATEIRGAGGLFLTSKLEKRGKKLRMADAAELCSEIVIRLRLYSRCREDRLSSAHTFHEARNIF